MSEAAQEMVVDAPLAEELERHGLHVSEGSRVRFELLSGASTEDDPPTRLRDSFVGQWTSPEADLSERAKKIARAEMSS